MYYSTPITWWVVDVVDEAIARKVSLHARFKDRQESAEKEWAALSDCF
jgi:hypothetical protein